MNKPIDKRKNSRPSALAIRKAREANLGAVRSNDSRLLMQSKRIENIDKANRTIRCSPGRQKEIPFKGVYKKGNRYQSRLKYKDKFLNLGSFECPEEAAKNYDYHCISIYGKGECYLNFPDINYKKFQSKKKSIIPIKDTAVVSVIYNPDVIPREANRADDKQ